MVDTSARATQSFDQRLADRVLAEGALVHCLSRRRHRAGPEVLPALVDSSLPSESRHVSRSGGGQVHCIWGGNQPKSALSKLN